MIMYRDDDAPWVEYTIQYVYGSYRGTERVLLSPNEINNGVEPIEKIWSQFRQKGYLSLGMATRSAKVIDSRMVGESYP